MRISDMLGQYNRNVTNGSEELRSAQSAGKMASTISELETGSIFEGTVNSIKGGRVTLALSNGQMISARLDGKVSLNTGDSMFFQVRSNDGATVAIKPYTTESGISNPILLNALSAAGIPATERSVSMVDAMMREQMSIGKQSILDMVKILNNNPEVKVSTLVQMTKIGLPVSVDMAAQFENYMANQHAILGEVEQAIGQLAEALGSEDISAPEAFLLYSRVLDILQQDGLFGEDFQGQNGAAGENNGLPDGGAGETAAQQTALQQTALQQGGVSGETLGQQVSGETAGAQQAGTAGETTGGSAAQQAGQSAVLEELFQNINGNTAETAGNPEQMLYRTAGQESGEAAVQQAGQENVGKSGTGAVERQLAAAPQTLEQLLDGRQLENLKQLLQNIPTLTGNTELFVRPDTEDVFVNTMLGEEADSKAVVQQTEGNAALPEAEFQKNMTASQFLNTVREALAQNSQYGFAGVHKFFASKEFQLLLKNMVEQQWLIKPGELKEENKINELYQRMEHQMKQMEQALKLTGAAENSFSTTASQVRGNIEFMNQINQIYTYVQLPLKLTGQNASGELYVYTNKKNLRDPDVELTAFLHLDLENLGSTDVSVKMLRKNVQTKFYIDNDASYDLLEKHLPVLEKRLKSKGYTCSITVSNEKKQVDFVGDFLQKDMPTAGTLHRYSFDMKA